MIACTAGGALIGGIARPSGVSVAWFGLAESPLAASSLRTSASDVGSANPAPGEPTLTAAGVLGDDCCAWAPAPATGSTACGWACSGRR